MLVTMHACSADGIMHATMHASLDALMRSEIMHGVILVTDSLLGMLRVWHALGCLPAVLLRLGNTVPGLNMDWAYWPVKPRHTTLPATGSKGKDCTAGMIAGPCQTRAGTCITAPCVL